MTEISQDPNNLKELLHRLGIQTVAIIDDAFNPPQLSADTLESLSRLIEEEDGLYAAQVASLCDLQTDDVNDARNFTDVHIARLWTVALSDDDYDFHNTIRRILFQQKLDAVSVLHTLRDVLWQADVQVLSLTPAQSQELPHADLWFVDLLWDGDGEDENAGNPALAAVKAQYQNRRHDPPFCVLMSSSSRLRDLHENFRKDSDVPAGYFLTLEKRIIQDNETSVATWITSNLEYKKAYFRRSVYALTRAIQRAAEGALSQYKDALRGLAAEDFAHIYRYSLSEEGAPLGSYMLWLFEPLFEHYLSRDHEVATYRGQMDRVPGDQVPTFDLVTHEPSAKLAEIHRARMWERSDKDAEKRLHQGDLLEGKTEAEVYLVLNADCDLAFSEDHKRKRKSISVLLLPGTILKFSLETNFTEFYDDRDDNDLRPVRIDWQFNKVLSIDYSEVATRYSKIGWRLRRPFAAELVQSWSHHVTRLGNPVSPSVVEKAMIRTARYRESTAEQFQDIQIPGEHECFLFHGKRQLPGRDSKLPGRNRYHVLNIRDVEPIARFMLGLPLKSLKSDAKLLRERKESLIMTDKLCKIGGQVAIIFGSAENVDVSKLCLVLIAEPV